MSSHQHDLFGARASAATPSQTDVRQERFGGQTYEPKQDGKRLNTQLECVRDLLTRRPYWWTLSELRELLKSTYGVHASEAGISARLRDLRKPQFGSHTIERRRHPHGNGLWQYRLVSKEQS